MRVDRIRLFADKSVLKGWERAVLSDERVPTGKTTRSKSTPVRIGPGRVAVTVVRDGDGDWCRVVRLV